MAASIRAQLDDERMRELIADLRELGLRFAEEGPGAVGGAAQRQDARAHRHAARLVARAGDRTDHGRRRARDQLGVEEDRLPRRRRERRLEARRRPSGWACRCSTKPGCASCSAVLAERLRIGARAVAATVRRPCRSARQSLPVIVADPPAAWPAATTAPCRAHTIAVMTAATVSTSSTARQSSAKRRSVNSRRTSCAWTSGRSR